MDTTQAQPLTLVFGRVLDWLTHFERAMEMQPVDYLELRVAELEHRLDRLPAVKLPSTEV